MNKHTINLCVPYPNNTSIDFYVDVELEYILPVTDQEESDWDYYGSFEITDYSYVNCPGPVNLKKLKEICKEHIRDMIINECFFDEQGGF